MDTFDKFWQSITEDKDKTKRLIEFVRYCVNAPESDPIIMKHCGEFEVESGFGWYYCPYCGKKLEEPEESYEKARREMQKYDEEYDAKV